MAAIKKLLPRLSANFLPKTIDGFIDYNEAKRLMDIGLASTAQIYSGLQAGAIQIEEAILGGCLQFASATKLVVGIFNNIRKPFYVENHNIIYNCLCRLLDSNVPIDLLTVFNDLAVNKESDKVGVYYLTQLSNKLTSSANIEYHARICFQHYIRRTSLELTAEHTTTIYDLSVDVFDMNEKFIEKIRKLENPFAPGQTLDMEAVMQKAFDTKPKRQIIGNLFRERDILILYGPAGVGKSILALQIADAISKGNGLFDNLFPNHCGEQTVLYFDFELEFADFKDRYFDTNGDPYKFSKNLYRFGDTDENPFDFKDIADNAAQILRKAIEKTKPNVVIVDNLTFLTNGNTSDAEVASSINNIITNLVKKHGASVILLAHVPKKDSSAPLELKDIKGSSLLGDGIKCAIALGQSNNIPDTYYIKQTKSRGSKQLLTSDNVLTYEIKKVGAFTQCVTSAVIFCKESVHLAVYNESDTSAEEEEIIYDMHINKKLSFRKIAKQLLGDEDKQSTVHGKFKRYCMKREKILSEEGSEALEVSQIPDVKDDILPF